MAISGLEFPPIALICLKGGFCLFVVFRRYSIVTFNPVGCTELFRLNVIWQVKEVIVCPDPILQEENEGQ